MSTLRRRALPATVPAWPDLHPVLARVYAARGLCTAQAIAPRLADLHAPALLSGMDTAITLLADALAQDARILIVGDYDADGATATAIAVAGLRMLGARHVDYAVPNRFRHGYGLSPALVAELDPLPQLLITVDNGIAAHAGVAAARAHGCRVLVTDHHLPGATLPAADAIVNPNSPGDAFPSKALAGVGVMFYLLLALRAHLRDAGRWTAGDEPDLAVLLDRVALGTVADLVPLDDNNRALVRAGLARMRRGAGCAGIRALFAVSGRDAAAATAADLGYALAPRINAAGRLEDMRIGIACLLAEDATQARQLAERLHAINAERREVQALMLDDAEALLAGRAARHGIALLRPEWHEGVVGLVAARIKEKLHRPVVAFAPSQGEPDLLRGSARSIPGLHIRDVLAEMDARDPALIMRFGGHAMAAGLALRAADFQRFAELFDHTVQARCDAALLEEVQWSDGELAPGDYTLDLALALRDGGPWGQGCPEPQFDGRFECVHWRVIGAGHWRLRLRALPDGPELDAVHFNPQLSSPPPRLRALYRLDVDVWNDRQRLRVLIAQMDAATD